MLPASFTKKNASGVTAELGFQNHLGKLSQLSVVQIPIVNTTIIIHNDKK